MSIPNTPLPPVLPAWCCWRPGGAWGAGECPVTQAVTSMAPAGGVTPMSRRVMNLAHFLTQNARRHGDRAGFIWGDRSWTWREIDSHVSALAAALAARGIVKGDRILVHS